MIEDPWKDLVPPNAVDAINARRVDACIPWGFFWARGIDRKCLLVLQHAMESMPHSRLPKLKGLEVTDADGNDKTNRILIFKLIDSAHRDIFYRLCKDVIASASVANTEKEALEISIARTWRWHHFLRGGGDGRLSLDEQKGLIGELLVLERYLMPNLSSFDSVSSWHGPLDAPKDFEIGRICIEAKARRGAAKPYIAVNSENQLDDAGTDALFLYVVELDRAPSDNVKGFSVSDVATRIRTNINVSDNIAADTFDGLLSATGFRWEDDYSDTRWIEGPSRLYQVSGSFPRITAAGIKSGIANVKYSLSLVECEPFLVTDDTLECALKGGNHGS